VFLGFEASVAAVWVGVLSGVGVLVGVLGSVGGAGLFRLKAASAVSGSPQFGIGMELRPVGMMGRECLF